MANITQSGAPPSAPPPTYQQSVGYQGYQGYQGPAPGVPSYAANPGYNTNYGTGGQQTVVVRQPGGYGYPGAVCPAPDHLGLAVLATVLCCWPIGIFAIMRALDARRALDRGDLPSAIMLSSQAKRFSMIAIGCGTALIVLVIVIVAVVVTTSSYYY